MSEDAIKTAAETVGEAVNQVIKDMPQVIKDIPKVVVDRPPVLHPTIENIVGTGPLYDYIKGNIGKIGEVVSDITSPITSTINGIGSTIHNWFQSIFSKSRITVTPEELKAQSEVVRKRLGEMQAKFDELKALLSGTSSFWIGEAGDVHRELYTKRQAMIEEMFARYQEQVNDLQIMAGVYEEAETKATGAADSLPASTL